MPGPLSPVVAALLALLMTVSSLSAQTVSFGGQTLRVNKSSTTTANAAIVAGRLQMNNTEFGAARSALSTNTVNMSGVWSENAYVGDWTLRPTTVVPEPSTYALLVTGLAAIAGRTRARRRKV
jgi:hypothetical protein